MENKNQSQRVIVNLEEHRPQGATSWEFPPWGQVLGSVIFPLLITVDKRFIPIGTAFCISKIGIVATATHNILVAL